MQEFYNSTVKQPEWGINSKTSDSSFKNPLIKWGFAEANFRKFAKPRGLRNSGSRIKQLRELNLRVERDKSGCRKEEEKNLFLL